MSLAAPPRSLLFVPGSRPDMIAKLPRAGADISVVDLEDAVAAGEKDAARIPALAAVAELTGAAGVVVVRLNAMDTEWFEADLAAAAQSLSEGGVGGVVLPKYEQVGQLELLRARLPEGAVIVVGLETALGVADSRPLLAAGPDAAYFGAEDYIADVGGERTAESTEVLYARSHTLLGAHLAGVAALDQAVMSIRDDERFRADAAAGRAIGYTGKICVHPRQVVLAHEVFSPTEAQLAHARAVLDIAEAGGVGTVDGQMVDDVHVRMARQVLARVRPAP
ncbi:MAG TPA: CoA ester lyase [Jatrophihabitans sp.]|uniref:HpcH/HpaI aldolase/citrate lyase family protein n=1 Tax=Jatrophihabitans sp. TaxID=1932789 RepID=UPI002E096268|nr:CoA ester lyase [Jatrophihabitans sp.]